MFPVAARQPLQIYVEVHGSDLSPDPSDFALPLATIGAALDRVGENDLIRVGEGVFEEFDLQIDASIGIIGKGPDKTIIRGGATPGVAGGGILSIDPGHRVLIDGIGITNGVANPAAPGAGSGGGIFNAGSDLVLTNVEVSGNRSADGASGGGGVCHLGGSLTVFNCTISGNRAGHSGNGGGILFAGGFGEIGNARIEGNLAGDENSAAPAGDGGGLFVGSSVSKLHLTKTTLTANSAGTGSDGEGGRGGGIFSDGVLDITDSLIRDNHAGDGGSGIDASGGNGGGIYNGGTITITNTTILDNAAGDGGPTSGVGGSGGAFDSTIATGPCRILNSTVVGNRAGTGVWGAGYGGGGHSNTFSTMIMVRGSIISGNTVEPGGGGPDLAGGGIVSEGDNLIGDSGFFIIENPALGDLSGVDPILGALADNGGPTLSLLPQPGSPAIGAITLGITPTIIDDQRGFLRIEPTTIGAVDPGATPPAIGGRPRLTIEMPRGATPVTLGRLMLDRSQQSMQYQLFVGDDPGQLAIPEGMPGGRISLSSPQAGTGAPLLWDVPFLAPLFQADGSRRRHAVLIIIVTPRIINPPE